MYSEEIKIQLEALTKVALEKGLGSPNIQLHIKANAEYYGLFTYYDPDFTPRSVYGMSASEVMRLLWDKMNEIPSKVERERNNYLKKIAEAVEYGKSVGIDDDLVNPLIEQMKRLSANIIEHKPPVSDEETPF